MSLPLEGIKVLDWTIWQQGPVCGAMLGDLGADVIKIEERVGGDVGRGMMRMVGVMFGLAGRNFYFEYNNRNKRGMTVDLRKDKGREIICKLVEGADVFLHNFRKGVPERLGMDYATLSQYNPRLIYATGSGWGPKGPDAYNPSMDYTELGRTGLMFAGGEEGWPPVNYVPGVADQTGAIMLAYAIMTALFVRERTGIGQEVEASMLGSVAAGLEGLLLAAPLALGQGIPRPVREEAGNPLYNHYKCKDGKWIILCLAQGDRFWPAFCQRLGIQHLEKDPQYENMEVRREHRQELIHILDEIFATKTRNEWMDILKQEEDFMVEPVCDLNDVAEDPQMWANDYIIEFDHPAFGKVKMPGLPVHFSKTPGAIRREAPEFGQHTEEVLLEAGYTWDDITKFKDEEVI